MIALCFTMRLPVLHLPWSRRKWEQDRPMRLLPMTLKASTSMAEKRIKSPARADSGQ